MVCLARFTEVPSPARGVAYLTAHVRRDGGQLYPEAGLRTRHGNSGDWTASAPFGGSLYDNPTSRLLNGNYCFQLDCGFNNKVVHSKGR